MNTSIEEHENRLKNFYQIEKQTWNDITDLGNGIFVYHNVINSELDVINRLESVVSDQNNQYNYSEAMVGYGMKMPEYRDCFDIKFKKTDIERDSSQASLSLQSLWEDVHFNKSQAVKDYCKRFNIGELRYWEALNFVKYGPGQHFQEHTDHGFSYNCVVSMVGYVNDDYEGGEIYFRMQGVRVKPKAGDLFVFPSNYMYPHQAMPVISGTKYSIVTMLDYSDKFHNQKFYEETGN
jgi:predicted 2-oxoglutarate/Fe(II)-dependent dioxygenase YbiX